MFKILIVLKKFSFMDNNDIIYDLYTLLFYWNIPILPSDSASPGGRKWKYTCVN